MKNKELEQPKRKFRSGEKFLLGVSLLAVTLLTTIGLVRNSEPRYNPDVATPEIACKSLVKAMLNQDETRIKQLTTAHGYSVLKRHVQNSQFNSYPKLANRMVTEWGKSMFWEEDALQGKTTNETGVGMGRRVKPGEKKPVIYLKRTPTGWKLDNYMPGPDRFIKYQSKMGYTWNLNE